jgi:hypothetical protein
MQMARVASRHGDLDGDRRTVAQRAAHRLQIAVPYFYGACL